jgi:hypothetical protein
MKKSITIFETHDEAVKALVELRESGVNMQKISLVGKAEIVDDQIHVKSNKPLIAAPIAVGTVAGTTLGLRFPVWVSCLAQVPLSVRWPDLRLELLQVASPQSWLSLV